MQRFKRNIPTVNATSTADIAFILLLFFLLTGSLNPDKGIFRRLLPDTSEARLKKKKDIERRNFLAFEITADNTVLMEGEPVPTAEIRPAAKRFITNPDNETNLPQKLPLEIENIGTVETAADAVISLTVSREANYETYIRTFGELSAAYDEARNDVAISMTGKPFSRLTADRQNAIREAMPIHIYEKETEQKGGQP
jgi:biopolymer transport protein ExbD